MKVKINRWRAVANWQWELEEDEPCGICKCSFESCCADCPEYQLPGDDCPIAKSASCKHVFHMHCILKAISKSPNCPMCRQAWDMGGTSATL